MAMTATPVYCSANSRDVAEPLWGTARHTERWLLIEYPGAWPAKVLKSGVLPPAMMKQLDAQQQAFSSFHTLFIRQSHTRSGPLRAFLVDCREESASIQRLEFDDYEQLAAMDLVGAWQGSGRQKAPEPALYLVCTHGTHDKCCAKFGLPVYASLTARYQDQVWEASHLGGHRFAANVIAFPTGVCYGRVTTASAVAVIERDERGELDLPHYRGRFSLAPPVQAAEYFIRKRLSLPKLADLRLDGATKLAPSASGDRWSVSFRDTRSGHVHQATVAYRSEPLQVLKDCEADAAEPVRPFVLVD